MTKLYEVELNSKGAPNFSTAKEVPERKHGKWIDYKDDFDDCSYLANCSECRYQIDTHHHRGYLNYCPNCGSYMRGE